MVKQRVRHHLICDKGDYYTMAEAKEIPRIARADTLEDVINILAGSRCGLTHAVTIPYAKDVDMVYINITLPAHPGLDIAVWRLHFVSCTVWPFVCLQNCPISS